MSWAFNDDFGVFLMEAKKQWQDNIAPYFTEIQKDKEAVEKIEWFCMDDVMKFGEISPIFPIELILQAYSPNFKNSSECLKQVLIFYGWLRDQKTYLNYCISTAIKDGHCDLPQNRSEQKRGWHCVETKKPLNIAETDKRRIINFCRQQQLWDSDMFEEQECIQAMETLLWAMNHIGEQAQTSDGEVFIFACPFLERIDEETSLCSMYSVRPKCCRE